MNIHIVMKKISSKQITNSNYEFRNLSEIAEFIRGITFSKMIDLIEKLIIL